MLLPAGERGHVTPATTTATTRHHWLLERYSRSRSAACYPENTERTKRQKLAQVDHSHASRRAVVSEAATELSWEHFNQPQIHMYLDVTNSTRASSPSQCDRSSVCPSLPVSQHMRLLICLEPVPMCNTTSNSQRVFDCVSSAPQSILEDISFDDFSAPSLLKHLPHGQLPLKAVYKKALIGFRYFHVATPKRSLHSFSSTSFDLGAPQRPQARECSNDVSYEWRRAQITIYGGESEVLRFKKAVSGFLPIKQAEERISSSNAHRLAQPNTSAKVSGIRTPVLDDPDPLQNSSLGNHPALAPDLVAGGSRRQSPSFDNILPRTRSPISCARLCSLDDESFVAILDEILSEQDDGKGLVALVEKIEEVIIGRIKKRHGTDREKSSRDI